jgi:hypothetical protein
MQVKLQIKNLLSHENSESELREYVALILVEGFPRQALIDQFMELHDEFMKAGPDKEKEDDITLNLLDYLTGWCSPHMRL